MGSQHLRDYQCLGGSARRYQVRATGETISYRQFLKQTQHINPEKRAAERKAAGLGSARRVRKDNGLVRGCPSARQRRKLTPSTIPVQIAVIGKKADGVCQVMYENKSLGCYSDRGHGARRYRCEVCHLRLREEASMILHIYIFIVYHRLLRQRRYQPRFPQVVGACCIQATSRQTSAKQGFPGAFLPNSRVLRFACNRAW